MYVSSVARANQRVWRLPRLTCCAGGVWVQLYRLRQQQGRGVQLGRCFVRSTGPRNSVPSGTATTRRPLARACCPHKLRRRTHPCVSSVRRTPRSPARPSMCVCCVLTRWAWACSSGVVFAWGCGDEGQLGDGRRTTQDAPTPLTSFFAEHGPASSVACGAEHSAAIAGRGQLFTWGRSQSSQLGLGTTDSVATPQLVLIFS